MSRLHAATIMGRAGYAIGCAGAALILVVSGFAYFVNAQLSGLTGGVTTNGAQTGAMNILVMGLESRTDYDGNILPRQLLTAMHAGSVQGVENGVGGQDTNTMILIHIFAGGKKAVGVSIPRDDYVTYPQAYDGQTQGKVDQAYGDAWQQSLDETQNDTSMTRDQRYTQANQAGQEATIATVSSLTGVKIDHFAEVNLAGFFYLAQAFGGVEVCLKSWNGGQNLDDKNSGFKQKSAGYHLLAADQALAFVRERDNLPNGDLDRTHRQQAVLDYVIWKLGHEGIFNSIGQLTSLLNMAKSYIRTDQGWNLLDFASQMHALTGKNLTFMTAPVLTTDGHVGSQTVNLISTTAVRQTVQNAFYPKPPGSSGKGGGPGKSSSLPAAATTVDVYNGGAPAGLGGQVSQGLTAAGFKAGTVADASAQPETRVLYGAGAGTSAQTIAGYFTGVTARASSSVAAGHVEVLLGPDATSVPASLTAAASGQSSTGAQSPAVAAPSSAPGTSGLSAPPPSGSNGQEGKAVTVPSSAKYGIPCVY